VKKINLLPFVLTMAAASVACSPSQNKSANSTVTTSNATTSANNAAAQPAANNQAQAPANANSDLPADMQAKAGRNGQQLHLAEGGFTSGSVGLHHANLIQFGQSQADVTRQLTEILGPPSGTGRNAECPTGAVEYATFGELNVNFQNGKFVGWVLDGPMRPELESYQGLMIGQTRRELSGGDGDPPTFEQSSLGSEFTSDGIGGLLDGNGPNAKVKTLFSGVTCFAR
jgi:hypothetical protein